MAEVRAGLNMRNVAVSGEGKYVMAANCLSCTLALFDANLNPVKSHPAATLDGMATSHVLAVYDAATAQVVNLDTRRKIGDLPIAGMPHLGSGITFPWKGTSVLVWVWEMDGALIVFDAATLKTLAHEQTGEQVQRAEQSHEIGGASH